MPAPRRSARRACARPPAPDPPDRERDSMPSRRHSSGTARPSAARIDAVRSIVMPTWPEPACRNSSRPANEGRHADAALPDGPLAVEERRVARQPFAAVVVGEDDDRVVRDASAVQRSGSSPTPLVDLLDHRDVVGPRAGRVVVRHHVARIVRCNGGFAGHLVRPVRRVVRDVDEERPSRAAR